MLSSHLITKEAAMEARRKTFTMRQRQVVELIAAGCSNEEVGRRLGVSPRTAKAHSDALRRKLGVTKRRQIPAAYRLMTGQDPLAELPAALGVTARTLRPAPDPGQAVGL
jgi:DNA-binding NarL/FixJ family response regulator